MLEKLSEKKLKDWAGWKAFRDGQSLFERGVVEKVTIDDPFVIGQLNLGPRGMRSKFEILSNGLVENHCPCRDNQERGLICCHLVAMGLSLLSKNKDNKVNGRVDRIAKSAKGIRVRRARKSTPGAIHAELLLEISENWINEIDKSSVSIDIYIIEKNKKYPIIDIKPEQAIYFRKKDNQLLELLEKFNDGLVSYSKRYSNFQFVEILKLSNNENILIKNSDNFLNLDNNSINYSLLVNLDKENGELFLNLHFEQDFFNPTFLLGENEGWIISNNNLFFIDYVLPNQLRPIYKKTLRISRVNVPSFIISELVKIEKDITIESDITPDLFYMKPAKPSFRLLIKGSPASLSAKLFANYDNYELVAGRADRKGNFAIPDANDLLKYRIRNMIAEKNAVEKLQTVGFIGRAGDTLKNIEGVSEVLNFLGSGVPKIQRLGWIVELEGRVKPFVEKTEVITPRVNISENSDGSYFDINYEYISENASIKESDIKKALELGNSFIEHKGKTILLDGDAIMQALEVFQDCLPNNLDQSKVNLESIYGSYVYSTLDSLDGIEVTASKKWMEKAKTLNDQDVLKNVDLSKNLKCSLRKYQKDGVNWLRFLENRGFCGILADEMGLGKTVQTLAWLQLDRSEKNQKSLPALIICPTSLVENWAEEVKRFTPDKSILVLQGSDRHKDWKNIPNYNIIITSYALMRRDIDNHLDFTYSVAILDEAQQIKNRTTQNALAAKKIQANHRLVLSGTPIENSVTDLWSIMDFLMPGYLGDHKTFHEKYELPIIHGGTEGDLAQIKLKRKLHPFLLRRLKKHVAKDLPPKIERIASCKLTPDQLLVYQQLLNASKNRIEKMVEKDGFNKSRMEILKTLLRLRQTCNHIDLLQLKDIKSKNPSGKMDLFFSLLNEAIDSSHRILVFSQFTGMLSILKNELEKKDIKYCYLDGSTKNRQDIVKLFNRDHSIPVFLMSLKAGGTGLNLTGADMVIHFDPWWNPAVENQATDRAHRIGQKRTVYSVKLITKGTIEEKVVALQESKKNIIDSTLTTDDQVMQKLTWEDVQKLLEL
ncbi:MAG: SNF2-related protein [Verrucomicrobiota bacterium]|nr:SNF2-related protein [Verrucomicrobiota bacterium]